MPLTVDEYKIGQLYMIARHSLEQSGDGEGIEVVENRQCEDPEHGIGQFTEKRVHLVRLVVRGFSWQKSKVHCTLFCVPHSNTHPQSPSLLDPGHLSASVLRDGARMELLSVHNHRYHIRCIL